MKAHELRGGMETPWFGILTAYRIEGKVRLIARHPWGGGYSVREFEPDEEVPIVFEEADDV